MIQAALIDNGLQGLRGFFADRECIRYTLIPVTGDFQPELESFDLLIVPNGCDHVAMAKVADRVAALLQRGGAVFCFDGWTTDWLPGFRWVGDRSKSTADVRYSVADDPANLMAGVNLDELIYHHGISGWWACGYIAPPATSHAVLIDSWQRAVVVWDTHHTPGTVFCTASAPLGDCGLDGEPGAIGTLYQNALQALTTRMASAPVAQGV